MKFTSTDFRKYKDEKRKITMITAYDYPAGVICEEAGIDVILVGDSLGMVVLGYEDTTKVTMDDMTTHASAVRRGAKNSYIIGDMPFLSYGHDIKESVVNAGRLISSGGCNAVKLEGGKEMCDTVRAVIHVGIPVIGHIGYTPQSVNLFGRNMVRGKSYEAAKKLIDDAKALENAGAIAIVLELVPWRISEIITGMLDIPTIGIGSGIGCDGQVLVINDMFNMYKELTPRHCKVYADIRKVMTSSVREYIDEVHNGSFPGMDNTFDTGDDIMEKLGNEYHA